MHHQSFHDHDPSSSVLTLLIHTDTPYPPHFFATGGQDSRIVIRHLPSLSLHSKTLSPTHGGIIQALLYCPQRHILFCGTSTPASLTAYTLADSALNFVFSLSLPHSVPEVTSLLALPEKRLLLVGTAHTWANDSLHLYPFDSCAEDYNGILMEQERVTFSEIEHRVRSRCLTMSGSNRRKSGVLKMVRMNDLRVGVLCESGDVYIVDFSNEPESVRYISHVATEVGSDLLWTPNDPLNLFTCGWDEEIRRTNIVSTDSSLVRICQGHTGAVLGLAQLPQTLTTTTATIYLASCSADRSIRFWNVEKRECVFVMDHAHIAKINSLGFYSSEEDESDNTVHHFLISISDAPTPGNDTIIENDLDDESCVHVFNVDGLVRLANESQDIRDRFEFVCSDLTSVEIELLNTSVSSFGCLLGQNENGGSGQVDLNHLNLNLDERVLNRMIWGLDRDGEIGIDDAMCLLDYYELFRALECPDLMTAILLLSSKIVTSPAGIARLYLEACEREEGGVIGNLSPSSSFTVAMLRVLKGGIQDQEAREILVEAFRRRDADGEGRVFMYELKQLSLTTLEAQMRSFEPLAPTVDLDPTAPFYDRFEQCLKRLHNDSRPDRFESSEGDVICAHRSILAYRLSFFHRLFAFDSRFNIFDEDNEEEGEREEVPTKQIEMSTSTLQMFIDYAYLDSVEFVNDLDELVDALIASDMYFEFEFAQKLMKRITEILDLNYFREVRFVAELKENGSRFLRIPEERLLQLLNDWEMEFGIEVDVMFKMMVNCAERQREEGGFEVVNAVEEGGESES